MKKVKKSLAVLLTFVLLVSCMAIGASAVATDYVTISTNQVKGMTVEETYLLTAIATVGKEVEWSTSNADVAVIDDGIIRATGVGQCDIYAIVGSAVETCTVIVENEADYDIKLIPERISGISVGETYEIGVKNATGKDIVWGSSNPNIISVDNKGIIKVNNESMDYVTIVATNRATGNFATCNVYIGNPYYEYINISGLQVGQTYQLPTDYDWSSYYFGYDYVASISNNGIVTANSVGEVYFEGCKILDNGRTAYLEYGFQIVPAVKNSISQKHLNMTTGETYELTASADCTWSSSDEHIAVVDPDGIVYTVNPGVAVISATFADGMKLSCEINISGNGNKVLKLSQTKVVGLREGETYELAATANFDGEVVWNTDGKIKIDQNGIVYANDSFWGYSTVTATCGGITAYCIFICGDYTEGYKYSFATQAISGFRPGETYQLSVNGLPEGYQVELFSSDGRYVSSNGDILTARGAGTVLVYGRVFNNGVYCGEIKPIVVVVSDDFYAYGIPSCINGLGIGETYEIGWNSNVDLKNSDSLNLTWEGDVFAFDPETGIVTGIRAGIGYINAFYNGVYIGAIKVVIRKDTREIITSVDEIIGIRPGETYAVSAKTNFETENEIEFDVVFGESIWFDGEVITARCGGISYIRYTVDDVSAYIKVKVDDNRVISLSEPGINYFGVGQTYQIGIGSANFDYSDYGIEYYSGNDNIVDIDIDTGIMTAVNPGNTYVYAVLFNQNGAIICTNDCFVTVIEVEHEDM